MIYAPPARIPQVQAVCERRGGESEGVSISSASLRGGDIFLDYIGESDTCQVGKIQAEIGRADTELAGEL